MWDINIATMKDRKRDMLMVRLTVRLQNMDITHLGGHVKVAIFV